MKAVIKGRAVDTDVLETEIQVLQPRRAARRVVEDIQLDRNPDFNPKQRHDGLSSSKGPRVGFQEHRSRIQEHAQVRLHTSERV